MISDFLQNTRDIYPTYSKVESDRFGMGVARLNIPIGWPYSDNEIVQICNESSADLLILRCPTSRIRLAQNLAELPNKYAFQADTLVYFSINLDLETRNVKTFDIWKFSIAHANDKSSIETLSQTIFQNYSNHYRSNHLINSQSIVDGYVEWALSGQSDSAKLTVFIETLDADKVGFALVSFDGYGAEIELNGVHPKFQSQGVYSALLQMLMSHLANQKIENLFISTQIQNTRVIRAWIKNGFSLDFSINTFHIMSRH